MTGSLKAAIQETDRRRELQLAYNQKNNITPQTIIKAIRDGLFEPVEADYVDPDRTISEVPENIAVKDIPRIIAKLKKQMEACARRMQFEEAAKVRDEIRRLREIELSVGGSV
jgi:excinuclease ABC subunit B